MTFFFLFAFGGFLEEPKKRNDDHGFFNEDMTDICKDLYTTGTRWKGGKLRMLVATRSGRKKGCK